MFSHLQCTVLISQSKLDLITTVVVYESLSPFNNPAAGIEWHLYMAASPEESKD